MAVTDLPERLVRWFDRFQQDRWWLAHPFGAVRKYADDRGSALAGLLTYQLFLGMLPLLVVVLTVLGRVLEGSDELREAALRSTLGQFPVLGSRIEENVGALAVGGPWIAITIGGLLWTSAGIYHSLQLALNQAWNVEGVHRQGFVSRHIRALILFTMVIGAAVGTSFLRGSGVVGWGPVVVDVLTEVVVSVGIAVVLLLGVFRIASSPAVPLRCLVPAAIMAGLLWDLLQRVGSWLVLDRLSQAQDLYGSIGFVVVTLFWINLLARSAIFANEWAVVSWRGLWPRRLTQPPLTEADRRVLEGLIHNERRRPEEHVDIRWDEGADDDDADDDGSTDQEPAGERVGDR